MLTFLSLDKQKLLQKTAHVKMFVSHCSKTINLLCDYDSLHPIPLMVRPFILNE